MTEHDLAAFNALIEHEPRNYIAAREIAKHERDLSSARSFLDIDHVDLPASIDPNEKARIIQMRSAFFDLTERMGGLEENPDLILELFATQPELANATLSRIEMNGEWQRTDELQRMLLTNLWELGYRNIHLIGREHPEAQTKITIPAGCTAENNYVAVNIRRDMLHAAAPQRSPKQATLRSDLKVVKNSWFALKISDLADISGEAANEVRLIVATAMFRGINKGLMEYWSTIDDEEDRTLTTGKVMVEILGDYKDGQAREEREMYSELNSGDFEELPELSPQLRAVVADARNLRDAMARNNITFDQIVARHELPDAMTLSNPESIRYLLTAVAERHDYLTPAATTYYVH